MLRRQAIPDEKIIESITRRLTTCGVRNPSRVVVTCVAGQVTLAGTIQHEHLRHPAIRAARAVEGVQRVIDQLKKLTTPGRQ
jgi:osmotically-inducible protein OsmY